MKALNWERECKGLQAGYIMQPMADHFHQSFNLYTVDLVGNELRCEQFTSLKPGGRSSEWLNIVCVPGIGQLNGGTNYDMHYIPAFKIGTCTDLAVRAAVVAINLSGKPATTPHKVFHLRYFHLRYSILHLRYSMLTPALLPRARPLLRYPILTGCSGTLCWKCRVGCRGN